jgi:hypothetical protein
MTYVCHRQNCKRIGCIHHGGTKVTAECHHIFVYFHEKIVERGENYDQLFIASFRRAYHQHMDSSPNYISWYPCSTASQDFQVPPHLVTEAVQSQIN